MYQDKKLGNSARFVTKHTSFPPSSPPLSPFLSGNYFLFFHLISLDVPPFPSVICLYGSSWLILFKAQSSEYLLNFFPTPGCKRHVLGVQDRLWETLSVWIKGQADSLEWASVSQKILMSQKVMMCVKDLFRKIHPAGMCGNIFIAYRQEAECLVSDVSCQIHKKRIQAKGISSFKNNK